MSPLTALLLTAVLSVIGGMLLMSLIRTGLEPSLRAAAFICVVVLVEVLVLKLHTLLPNP